MLFRSSTKILTDSGYKIIYHDTTKEELDELKSSLKLEFVVYEYEPSFECDFLECITFGLDEYDLRAFFFRVKTSSQAKKLCKFYRYKDNKCQCKNFDNIVFLSYDVKINELLSIELD